MSLENLTNQEKQLINILESDKNIVKRNMNDIKYIGLFGRKDNIITYERKVDNIINTITINNEIYNFNKILEKGSTSSIIEYTNINGISIVIKEGDIKSDLEVINTLKKIPLNKYNICNIISYEIIDKNDNFYLMDKADGDLYSLIGTDTLKSHIQSILIQCTTIIKYLFDMDIYYTDIKPMNFLYKIQYDKSILVLLGDIGGAASDEYYDHVYENIMEEYTSTYLPINKKDGMIEPNESDLIWMLGINAVALCGHNVDKYHYSRIDDLTNKIHVDFIKNLLEIKNKVYPHKYIRNALDTNECNMRSLEKLLELAHQK